jgi:hypothetical protein
LDGLFVNRGWDRRGAQSYRHHCGAAVWQSGEQTWAAKKVEGHVRDGFETAEQAIQWIESQDSDFWTINFGVAPGGFSGLGTDGVSGYLDSDQKDHVIALFVPDVKEFPTRLQSALKRRLFSLASCARCRKQPSEIKFRPLPAYRSDTERRVPYIVCGCGYPVWRIAEGPCYEAVAKITAAEYSWGCTQFRKELLAIRGGKHTKREIQEILTLQENRCIYCNVLFSEREIPTRDHLNPVLRQGTDRALNIVMACRSCNSRRGLTYFRTYCKRLSPTQNRRILQHLCRRIDVTDLEYLPPNAFAEFLRLKRLRSRLANDILELQDKKAGGKDRVIRKGRPAKNAAARKPMTEAQRKQRVAAAIEAVKWI